MSKEKRRVPKLRFPGFTEDWEQRKFNDLFKERREKTIKENEETLLSCAITGIYLNSELFSHFRGSSTIGYLKIKKYDLILSAQNLHLGNANINLFFENGMISPAYKVFELKSIDPYFINAWVKKDATKNFFLKATTEGASQCRKNIEWDVLLNQEIPVPNNLEQIAIGKFINKLDMNITLHQRKLNNLKLKKKALLQKLFPKNGERYPELRFPGFTDAWEQCKLSVLATMNARIGWQNLRTSEFLDNGDYLLITGTDFDNGRIKYSTCHYVEKKRFDQDTKIQLSTGSILITKDGTLGKVALVEELPKPATLNAGVFNVRVKDDAFLSYKYLYHYLKAPFLMKYVTANATGGTIKHLNQSILVDFPIPITGKQEQDRIAKLLDSLESIITLHQRKLDHLQLQKKALLQQMFV